MTTESLSLASITERLARRRSGLLREALAWTEGITEVNGDQVRTECTALAREYFEDGKLADLTMAVIAINSWNRLATSFRAVAGTYGPAKEHAAG